MRASKLLGLLLFLLAGGGPAQEDVEKIQSGLKAGEVLPGPFDAFNINGKIAKGRQHCLVCDFGLHPVVMVFVREPAEGKDGPLMTLLARLDEAVSRYADDRSLGSCAVFISPDGHNSATNAGEEDPKKIVEEAIARDALVRRLEERAEKLKNVVVAYVPAGGPKDYHINPKADVTVLFYIKHKVVANFAFAEGKMAASDVDTIIKAVDDSLTKKTPAKK
jgi:hypothetical protein